MAYLGRQPIIGNYQVLDAITASATATYALTKNSVAVFPQTPANCIVSLNGVIQAPFDSYTISGSNIVFASALTGSDSIDFITVLGDVLNVGTVSDGTIGLAKLSATGTKDATTFLRGDNTFQTIGTNTPAFEVKKTSDQSVTTGTLTQVTFDTEIFDTDNAFSSNTFTVPAGKNGKYYFYSTVHFRTSTDGALDSSIIYIYKNGAEYKKVLFSGGDENVYGLGIDATMELSVSDTIKIYGLLNASSGTLSFYSGYTTYFGGYKLIE